ncbi:MAG: Rhomboid protease GlpG [Verrucomicrobiota bacterium]|jgi:GlpG protein
MRLIGHLPTEAAAATFSDFLCVEGIQNQVESDADGWGVWVLSEDEWPRARDLLGGFQSNPLDARFQGKAMDAARRRRALQAEAEEAARRIHGRQAVFRATAPYGVGWLTALLLTLCVGLAVLAWVGLKDRICGQLLLTNVLVSDTGVQWLAGLREIRAGELWRLLTPAFVHVDPLHLLFNMLWLLDLGSMIEGRLGTTRLSLKILLFAVLSNLFQYAVAGPYFYGFSGVNYGLFGYVWIRGRFDPRSGLYLHPHTVAMMVIWYGLCFTGLIKNVANGAHAAGLSLGIIWGYLESLPAIRHARRRATSD